MIASENFTRLGYSTNGNSRYVVSHLFFIADGETLPIKERYAITLSRAALLGGKKYHNKDYAGGILFESESLDALCQRINDFMERREWEVTKVIFRKYPNGDIIALFPEIAGDRDWAENCLSYMTVGQHGSASYKGVMADTSPCSTKEAIALRDELQNIGYNLRSMKRQTQDDVEMRREATL